MKPATAVRLGKATKAALNLAARRDPRITNRNAWRDGLSGVAEHFTSRNVQRSTDDQVAAVVAAAYAVDRAFGLYVETAAVTGARLSQIARLTVADLQDGKERAALNADLARRVAAISRASGRCRSPASLAAKLTSNRPAEAPLLLRTDGRAWQSSQDGDHERLYAAAAARAGVEGTIYALRHSSIVRSLLANIPVRIVAPLHDTS